MTFSAMLASLFNALGPHSDKPLNRARNIWAAVKNDWYLGFTSFGGPAVHFQIVCGH